MSFELKDVVKSEIVKEYETVIVEERETMNVNTRLVASRFSFSIRVNAKDEVISHSITESVSASVV